MANSPRGWGWELNRSLSRIDPFSTGAWLGSTALVLIGILLYEGAQFGYENPRYWLSALVSLLVFVTLYFLFMLPFARIARLRASGVGKFAAFLAAISIRSVISTFIFFEDAELALALLAQRGPGDISVAAIYWAALATMITANSDYKVSLAELNRISAELEDQRDKRTQAAQFADQRLKELALTALGDELEKIASGLGSVSSKSMDRDIWTLSAEIKQLIETKVRPLSRDLRNRLDLVSDLQLERSMPIGGKSIASLKLSPRQDFEFLLAYLVASINIFITVFQLAGLESALLVQAISLTFPLIAWLISKLHKPTRRVGILAGISLVFLSALVAYTPTLWLLNLLSRTEPDLALVQWTAFGVYFFVTLAFTGWSASQRTREEQLEEIARSNFELSRELALIDQALWVARRKWSYLIHGTVQGALTVANSRLVFAKKPREEVIAQVIKDVGRAKQALTQNSGYHEGTAQLLQEIVASWEGLCSISLEVSDQTLERLDQDEPGKTCFVELAKELVSNAYRHGQAKRVWISGYLAANGDVRVIAANDGSEISETAESGLGFAMFDELTSNWSIERQPETRFVATIPLAGA